MTYTLRQQECNGDNEAGLGGNDGDRGNGGNRIV